MWPYVHRNARLRIEIVTVEMIPQVLGIDPSGALKDYRSLKIRAPYDRVASVCVAANCKWQRMNERRFRNREQRRRRRRRRSIWIQIGIWRAYSFTTIFEFESWPVGNEWATIFHPFYSGAVHPRAWTADIIRLTHREVIPPLPQYCCSTKSDFTQSSIESILLQY